VKVEESMETNASEKEESLPSNPSYQGKNVEMFSLKDSICRFRLTGPLSQSILGEVLKPSELPASPSQGSSKWWQEFFRDESRRKAFQEQEGVWQSACYATSAAELPPNMVLGLAVRDPRLFIPHKKCLQPSGMFPFQSILLMQLLY
jgi:ribonuclease P/MRP protein subunit POP1